MCGKGAVLTGPEANRPADDAAQRVASHTAVDGVVHIVTKLTAGEGWKHQGAVGHLVPQSRHGRQGTTVLLSPVDGGLGASSSQTL